MQRGNKDNSNIERKLIENLVGLQKAETALIEKFDKLSDQISALLALFETAARSFAKQPEVKAGEKDKEFLSKIDRLLEQNKTIARGLTLMEEKVREKIYGPTETLEEREIGEATPEETLTSEFPPSQQSRQARRPMPRF